MQTPAIAAASLVERSLVAFFDHLVEALPSIAAGLLFLVVAGVAVKLILTLLRATLSRTLEAESPVYRQFITSVVAIFLWFGVGLSFLSIVGLDGIATSLGTAAGFVALGVSYATSDMIADTVAGIYLLRDPDFTRGDTVVVEDMTGVVKSIELRKTRFDVDGDTVIRGNAEIEKMWTKRSEERVRDGTTSNE